MRVCKSTRFYIVYWHAGAHGVRSAGLLVMTAVLSVGGIANHCNAALDDNDVHRLFPAFAPNDSLNVATYLVDSDLLVACDNPESGLV